MMKVIILLCAVACVHMVLGVPGNPQAPRQLEEGIYIIIATKINQLQVHACICEPQIAILLYYHSP